MAIVDDVTAVLAGPLVKKIDFHLGKLSVSAAKLGDVASAMRNGTIKVEVRSTGGRLSAGYSPAPIRKMALSSDKIVDALDRSGIVHESVHAVVDLSGQSAIGGRLDEAVAYIAESIYLSASGVGLSRIGADPAGKKIYTEAYAVVDKHHLLNKQGVRLSEADCEALGKAIAADTAAYPGL